MQGGHLVLADGQVGDAVEPHPPGAPRLGRRPLDQVEVVLGLLVAQQVGGALRGARPPQVAVDHGVAVGHPEGRVGSLPTGEVRHRDRVGLGQHAELEVDPPPAAGARRDAVLAVGVGAHDGRHRGRAGRPEDVRPQGRAVPHDHRDVPVDGHGPRFGHPDPRGHGVGQPPGRERSPGRCHRRPVSRRARRVTVTHRWWVAWLAMPGPTPRARAVRLPAPDRARPGTGARR